VGGPNRCLSEEQLFLAATAGDQHLRRGLANGDDIGGIEQWVRDQPAYGSTNTGHVFLPQTPEYYGYDLDGNLTNDGRWTYGWDAENRLTNMTSLAGGPAGSLLKLDFAYDYMGRRIQKIVSTNNGSSYVPSYTNKFVYDGWNVVGILDGGNNLLYSFVWGLDVSGAYKALAEWAA
jgi:YD repeat-containing protein